MSDLDSASSQAPGAPELSALARRVRSGELRAVARLITGLENGDGEAVAVLRSLRGRNRSHVVGITGPPGSGKSTLTDKLIALLRESGSKVGVLAVDPSSPFTGGAILGDRLRMQHHATDRGVFIRSLASRGTLGGLSRATAASVRVLAAAGYDWILVETVGVGQSEVDIVKLADTVVLVSVPGLGDDIQVIKAGIMEIGDIFVVNKADREGADRVVREIRGMLETAAVLAWARSGGNLKGLVEAGHHGLSAAAAPAAAPPAKPAAPLQARGAVTGPGASGLPTIPLDADGHPVLPPILKTVAETGEGCAELLSAIREHREKAIASGELELRRIEGARAELRSLLGFRLLDALEGRAGAQLEGELARSVAEGERDIYEAAESLFAAIVEGGTS